MEELLIDKLPPEWKNPSSISVLFAPFRNRNVNPKDFECKFDFWSKSIKAYCTYTKNYSFTLQNLQKSFQHEGKTPMCLEVVLQELLRTNVIAVKDDILGENVRTWSAWATNLMKQPINWSLSMISSPSIIDKCFVHREVLQVDSKKLLDLISTEYKNSKLLEVGELEYIVKTKASDLKAEQLTLLLCHLANQQKIVTKEIYVNSNRHTLLKLDLDKANISNYEIDLYTLRQSEKLMISTIEQLETNLSELINEAKEYLKKGHKQLAKNSLRKKHDLEKRLEHRTNALLNIQKLLSSVEDSKENTQVLNSYKTAMNSLKSQFKSDKLNGDSVADTMLEIGEILDEHSEIQTILSTEVHDDFDTDELEKELDDIMSMAADEECSMGKATDSTKTDQSLEDLKAQFKELNLPDVPSHQEELVTPNKVSL